MTVQESFLAGKFLKWVEAEGKQFSHGNIDSVFQEFVESSQKKVLAG